MKCKYDHSLIRIDYSNRLPRREDIIRVICYLHGEFKISYASYKSGRGCAKCAGNIKYTTNNFIERAKSLYNHKYNYSKVIYQGSLIPIIITCKKHGDFKQTPTLHLNQHEGCRICRGEQASLKQRSNLKEFIKKARKIHNIKYSYSKAIYINTKTSIIIICKIHGEYLMTPSKHLSGRECQKCNGKLANGYWNKERCIDNALNYNTKTKWQKFSPSAYGAARNNGWFEEATNHMVKK